MVVKVFLRRSVDVGAVRKTKILFAGLGGRMECEKLTKTVGVWVPGQSSRVAEHFRNQLKSNEACQVSRQYSWLLAMPPALPTHTVLGVSAVLMLETDGQHEPGR